jgi:aspartyl-tRNA(Asn)/glutamyl-tRNA(Gln) amidotransferase subunit A
LDQAGVIARSAQDCAMVLEQMIGFDPRDPTSLDIPPENYSDALNTSWRGVRVGLPTAYFADGLDDGVRVTIRAALKKLEDAGAILVDVELPHAPFATAAYYVIASAEASSNLARFDGVRFGHRSANAKNLAEMYALSRSEGFGAQVQQRILLGTFALSSGYYDAYYGRAQCVRRLVANDFDHAFAGVDVLACATAPTVAFGLGAKQHDALSMYLADVNTVAVNLAGMPALSMPCGLSDGLPVGLQLIAPRLQEARLLALAHAYQQTTDWHLQMPGVHA